MPECIYCGAEKPAWLMVALSVTSRPEWTDYRCAVLERCDSDEAREELMKREAHQFVEGE